MPERERRVGGQGQPCSATAFYHYAPPPAFSPASPLLEKSSKDQARCHCSTRMAASPLRYPGERCHFPTRGVDVVDHWTMGCCRRRELGNCPITILPYSHPGSINTKHHPLILTLIPSSVPSMRSLVGSKANACNSSGSLHLAPCPLRIGFWVAGTLLLFARSVLSRAVICP